MTAGHRAGLLPEGLSVGLRKTKSCRDFARVLAVIDMIRKRHGVSHRGVSKAKTMDKRDMMSDTVEC